ncbi:MULTISPECIES: YbaB/EbfC family nucleoid-associated protein [unclassified Synechococcus]|uniref:YbaB/EbfC family nucleoid-associated protein n=1 Tax=unclassified Synechococcus TaxID=2626047 RepID=UPI002001A3C4|nr:YbaB/EbfC family nucleoid-associated protein [Synechococcus sp. A10-1-5-1]UPM49362.1 YbaB/EbfC family nucleoid-associated protein [Synechococcus sp. A10-1-5-1]
MAGFGLPNFGQLTEAFKKAQQIQQDAAKLQEELDAMEIEGQSSCGRASVWLSGNQQPLKVRLDPALLAEGVSSAESATLEALKSAYDNSTGTMKERMEELTGGLNLNLPGMG